MLNMSSNNKVTCQGSSCVNDTRSTINSKVKPNPKSLRLIAWLINELIKHKIKYKISFVQLSPKFLLAYIMTKWQNKFLQFWTNILA
jgi:hypothetical protein